MKQPNYRRMVMPALILLAIVAIFAWLYAYAYEEEEIISAQSYSVYDKGVVTQILSDNSEQDPNEENAYRGQQKLIVDVISGENAGKTMIVDNLIGVHTDYAPLAVGDEVVLDIVTNENGNQSATVYEYNREPIIYLILVLFIVVTVLVGGKTGAKSILGLALTIAVLFLVFLPLLEKAWDPILTAFFLCSLITIACFVILGGCTKKVLCACIGTIAGMAIAMLFGILAQKLLRVDAYQAEYAEALKNENLLQLKYKIRGLLVAGVIISALGAVMDVAMSISSALHEVKTLNPQLKAKELWKSGMNIGRDMVGTMTNTLILAILGSSLMMILFLHSMAVDWNKLMSSSFLAIEIVSSVASAIGVILAVPLTTLCCAWIYGAKTGGE